MDSTSILPTVGGSFVTNFQARYNNGDCMTFINEFQIVYTNYYVIKAPVYTGIVSRSGGADTDVTTYKNSITTLGTAFNTVKTNLQSTANAIVDPTYGLLAGLNCAIFGEDIVMVVSTFCSNGFQLMFFIRAAFGIAAFGILFSMWCASCTGVRHYKQM